MLCYTILYYTILHYTTSYYTTLHYTALHHSRIQGDWSFSWSPSELNLTGAKMASTSFAAERSAEIKHCMCIYTYIYIHIVYIYIYIYINKQINK